MQLIFSFKFSILVPFLNHAKNLKYSIMLLVYLIIWLFLLNFFWKAQLQVFTAKGLSEIDSEVCFKQFKIFEG